MKLLRTAFYIFEHVENTDHFLFLGFQLLGWLASLFVSLLKSFDLWQQIKNEVIMMIGIKKIIFFILANFKHYQKTYCTLNWTKKCHNSKMS